jgi:hypothetical protein
MTAPAKPKHPGGRPPFEPTDQHRQIVRMLAGFGIPLDGIAQQVKDKSGAHISDVTLRKYFAEELASGVHEANAKVAGSLFKAATQDNQVGAMIFWLKTRARWRETPQEVAFTDPDGNPVKPPTLADFYTLMGNKPQGE